MHIFGSLDWLSYRIWTRRSYLLSPGSTVTAPESIEGVMDKKLKQENERFYVHIEMF